MLMHTKLDTIMDKLKDIYNIVYCILAVSVIALILLLALMAMVSSAHADNDWRKANTWVEERGYDAPIHVALGARAQEHGDGNPRRRDLRLVPDRRGHAGDGWLARCRR